LLAAGLAAAGLTERRLSGAVQSIPTLRLAGPVSGLPSLDPALSREIQSNYLLGQVFRGLVTLDDDLLPVPGLAESIERFDDGRRYRFVLRPQVAFQDGTMIEARHVAGSLARALNPAIAGGDANALAARTYLGDIEGAGDVLAGAATDLQGVSIPDERTIEISLVDPSATFLGRLTNIATAIVDVDQIASDADWSSHPNGSGPYAVTEWEWNDHLTLRAAGTWWAGTPAIEEVTVRLGAAAASPVNLYQAGDIDLIASLAREDVALVKDPASGMTFGELVETTSFSTVYIALGNQVAPLDDPDIRRALQLVFPATRYAAGQFGEFVVPATGLVPPGMLGAAWDAQVPDVDLGAAEAAIACSRYGTAGSVPTIEVYAADVGPIEALREAAAGVGLDVQVFEVPFPDFVQGLAERRFPAYSIFWTADYPDPESLLGMLFRSSSPDNYTGYHNADFDDLLATADISAGAERAEVLTAANQLLVDDGAVIAVYYPRGFTLVREGLAPVEVTPLGVAGLETLRGAS
jgi:ABC-type transport system substrate-binding protein